VPTTSALGGGRADRDDAWSPNQQVARDRIAHSAARLVAREGLSACTLRAVAAEGGFTKSAVHYYVQDAHELVDLAVQSFLRGLAAEARIRMDEAADGAAALCVLVRLFMGRGVRPFELADPMIWAEYTIHAWHRDARLEVIACMETISTLFTEALERSGVDEAAARARAVHHYLLGAVQLHIVSPIPPEEIARAVCALTGVDVDPAQC
jgi:DNA-binding transcriptional regulator YbjK